MMAIVHSDSHLHTLMYFFLSNFSFVDLSDSSAVAPKMVAALQSGNKVISYNGCAAQFFFVGFAMVEFYLWPSWSMTTMQLSVDLCITPSPWQQVCVLCWLLAAMSVASSMLPSTQQTPLDSPSVGLMRLIIFSATFPHSWLSHAPTHASASRLFFFVIGFNVFSTLLVILISYLFIYIAIQRMRSAEGQKKAFSTCGSHLTTVSIFHATIIFLYLQPPSSQSLDMDKTASLFHTVVISMLNSLIYSLRNKEVKNTLWKILNKLYPQSLSMSRRQAGNQRRNLPSGKMPSWFLTFGTFQFFILPKQWLLLLLGEVI